jgi:two-component system CheB/CheR fusion protein
MRLVSHCKLELLIDGPPFVPVDCPFNTCATPLAVHQAREPKATMTPDDSKATPDNTDPQPPFESDRSAPPVDRELPPRLAFPVVGIGASAGGLEAFTEFFKAMRPDSGMAFVLIQHLPPDRDSMIAEILSRHTRMRVSQVENGMPVEVNVVYVIRPGNTMTIKDGVLHLGEDVGRPLHSRPVDDFFKSLAEEQRERSICIIMSGMGSNGTAGAQAVKAVGGLCIAQDPESAQFSSMPRHLVDAGYADYVLRVTEMPDVLLGYVKQPYVAGTADVTLRNQQQQLREILAILRTRTRQDFSGYKKPTVLRRIQRRMGINRLTNLNDYARLLRQSTTEVNSLGDDLLIHVTGFFRDRAAWEALRTSVIVPLIASREPNSQVRCWVTACSSGEEAYSLAMLLVEECEAARKTLDIKVFATDTAERTLGNARGGIYPGGIEAELSPQRLERFFQREDAVYRVRPELRQTVVFAPQNILQDPPFSRLDIATCRNLLIYLEPAAQKRLLSVLHFGLRQGGTLFLGTSETVGEGGDLFEVLDKKARIYRRVGPTRHGAVDFPLPRAGTPAAEALRTSARPTIAQLTNAALLARHVPAAVTVDRDLRIVYFHGNTRAYFDQPTGEPSREILTIALESMRGAIRSALQIAMADNRVATVLDGWLSEGENRKRIAITASPLDTRAVSDYFVVSFEERPEPELKPAAGATPRNDGESTSDLQRIRDELQSTIEELQTSNEEHKASAEEVMSMNEEMQSTNEELETSREEMQSLNEELTTVNGQLQSKMEEYQTISSDLSSLLSSTDIAVLFLDPKFCIRRFTPAVRDLLELISGDVGRPLSDLAWKFSDPDLMGEAQMVMAKLVPCEREISAENGKWYLRRVLPYRTSDSRIDGLVITFVDITERRRMEALLAEKARLLDLSHDVIIVRDLQNRVIYWNHGAADLYGYSFEEARGKNVQQLLHPESEMSVEALVAQLRARERIITEAVHHTRDGRRITALCRWTLDQHPQGGATTLLMTATDITDRKTAEAAARQSEQQFRLLVEAVRDFAIFMTDPQGHITTWNPAAERLLGWTEAEVIGKSAAIIFTREDRDAGRFEEELSKAARTGRAADERWHVTRDGRRFWGSGVTAAVGEPGEKLRGYVKILRDETVRKQGEEALVEANRNAEVANRMKDEFLATLSHELRTPLSAILLWTKLCRTRTMDAAQLAEGLSAIQGSANAQKALIEDLLDISRIISGKLRLKLLPVELASLIQDAVDAILPAAAAKGITLNLDLRPDVGVVMIDGDRIRQVIWNLLTNSVKFSPKGARINVALSRRSSLVEIRVTDTGRGISAEFLPHVFDRFRQADASSTRRHGGLGLGLDISRQLVELHGGTIEVESEGLGKGATFIVNLPLRRVRPLKNSGGRDPKPDVEKPPTSSDLIGTRILLVEDETQTRNALSIVLNQAGAEVVAVGTAAAAFTAYNQQPPDVIVSDIGLPEEDGYTLLQRIREHEQTIGDTVVPAIALSAFTRDEDRVRALQAGFQSHLGKPIDAELLTEALRAMITRK